MNQTQQHLLLHKALGANEFQFLTANDAIVVFDKHRALISKWFSHPEIK